MVFQCYLAEATVRPGGNFQLLLPKGSQESGRGESAMTGYGHGTLTACQIALWICFRINEHRLVGWKDGEPAVWAFHC